MAGVSVAPAAAAARGQRGAGGVSCGLVRVGLCRQHVGRLRCTRVGWARGAGESKMHTCLMPLCAQLCNRSCSNKHTHPCDCNRLIPDNAWENTCHSPLATPSGRQHHWRWWTAGWTTPSQRRREASLLSPFSTSSSSSQMRHFLRVHVK